MIELGVSRGPDRVEHRASYTDTLVAAIQSAASGEAGVNVAALGPLEIAAGLWSRAFASAVVTPQTTATAAVTPAILAMIGRELVRRGECCFEITVERIPHRASRVTLIPISHWDIFGRSRPASWIYRCDRAWPSSTETATLPAAAVVHCVYSVEPARPWLGRSPLQFASDSGKLAGAIEARLGEEISGPVGSVIPVPADGGWGGADDPLADLKLDIGKLRGAAALVPSLASGFDDKGAAPQSDWKVTRIGADPPDSLSTIRDAVGVTILGACGVPPSLATTGASDTGQRESWRRFLHGTILPSSKLVAAELAEKLDAPGLTLNFEELRASDIQSRARAWRTLAGKEAAFNPDRASEIAGLS